jgi:hypothetical protein
VQPAASKDSSRSSSCEGYRTRLLAAQLPCITPCRALVTQQKQHCWWRATGMLHSLVCLELQTMLHLLATNVNDKEACKAAAAVLKASSTLQLPPRISKNSQPQNQHVPATGPKAVSAATHAATRRLVSTISALLHGSLGLTCCSLVASACSSANCQSSCSCHCTLQHLLAAQMSSSVKQQQ